MRVSIRLNDIGFDVTVPDDVPAAELLPALWDIGIAHGADEGTAALSRHLYAPGVGPVDPSATLTEAGVTDGELLVLTTESAVPTEVLDVDPARALARHTRDRGRWTPRRSRIAALAAAACAAAAVGATAIPEAPVPRLLLAAAAVATVAVPAARRAPGVTDVFAPVAMAAGLVIAAALPAMIFDAGIALTGLALAAVALVVLATAGRAVLTRGGSEPARWAGLHARVVAGAAAAAGIGAVLADDVVFSAVAAVVLLLRAGHPL
ncbi:EsaB/YukD family protein, partial [Mycolicibacterium chitae]